MNSNMAMLVAPAWQRVGQKRRSLTRNEIIAYLESGHLLYSSSEIAKDWLANDPDVEIGPPHVLSDGKYAWPADLSYYVHNYHVRLPRHFVKHIQRNNFRSRPTSTSAA